MPTYYVKEATLYYDRNYEIEADMIKASEIAEELAEREWNADIDVEIGSMVMRQIYAEAYYDR